MKKGMFFLLCIVAAGTLLLFILVRDAPSKSTDGTNPEGDVPSQDTWKTYESDTFDFSISYPPTWNVSEGGTDIAPKITFYPPSSDAPAPPYDHWSEANHVSVFPKGIPTEGVQGKTAATRVSVDIPLEQGTDYVLVNGTPWATYLNFYDEPDSWEPYGFLWAKVLIEDGSTGCLRGGEPVEPEECDPIFGDTIIHEGRVDTELRETEERMMESFRFRTP